MTWKDRSGDRRLLGTIATLAILTLAGVVLGVFIAGKELSKEAWGLLGVVVGGLISQPQAVIASIKESWLGRTIDRQGDALQMSMPPANGATGDLPRPSFARIEESDDESDR